MQTDDIQITKTYPPEVEECRQRYIAVMDDIKRESESRVAAIHPLLRRAERVAELKRIQHEYHRALWPFVEELSRLENYATVTISKAA